MLNNVLSSLPFCLPLLLLAGALPWPRRWAVASTLNGVAAIVAVLAVTLPSFAVLLGTAAGTFTPGLTSSAHIVSVLVAFLGFVIVAFSRNHLRGEPGRDRYLVILQLALASVMVVVLADHLLVLLIGWIGISLALHRLLLFFPERRRAALAAHKKFLLARGAELALLGAALLLHGEYGTWRISVILDLASVEPPGTGASVAMVLIAVVALVKCAQLPVHGWLIQVVEAPTPVSALLHAGIINLGGYLLILFAPLFAQVPAARWLVLVVAGISMVLTALIMSTQASIKVRLAWSTSAQMGLMLVECALGLYELALLHLLAHGCYKAYAFLSSGTAVVDHVARTAAPRLRRPTVAWLGAAAVALSVTVGTVLLLGKGMPMSPWFLAAAMVTMFLAERSALGRLVPASSAIVIALLLLLAYAVQKRLVAAVLPGGFEDASLGADLWVIALFLAMTSAFWILREYPKNATSRRLETLLHAGCYLDEWLTRLTLRVWPMQFPKRNPRANPTDRTSEVY